MALIQCMDCKKEISDKASACPHCGCPVMYTIQQNENPLPNTALNGNQTQVPKEKNNSKAKKICIALCCFLIIAAIALTVGIFVDKKMKSEAETPVMSSTTEPSTKANAITTTTVVEKENKTTTTTEPIIIDAPGNIHYINNVRAEFDNTNDQHRVFFGFTDINGNYLSAQNGNAIIEIINNANETVFYRDIAFSSADFSSWSNNFWDSDRWLACLYINNYEITNGSAPEGKLLVTVNADGYNFDTITVSIFDLPTKNISINLPNLPQTFSDYGYTDTLEARVRVDEITYTSDAWDYDNVTVTFSFLTSMLYNSTPGTSKYVFIGYKLKNSSGIIVDSGTIGVSQSDVGDVSLTNLSVYGLNMKETYTLELMNSTD